MLPSKLILLISTILIEASPYKNVGSKYRIFRSLNLEATNGHTTHKTYFYCFDFTCFAQVLLIYTVFHRSRTAVFHRSRTAVQYKKGG